MKMRILGLLALLIGLVLGTAARCDDGKLDIVGRFESHSRELVVATYTTNDGQDRVGLLAWRAGESRNSFALRLDAWDGIFELWRKAARAQGREWKAIGTVTETGTSDTSRIDMRGGPGVELAIASPKHASIAYVLPSADFARFEQAMRDMKAALKAVPAKK